MKRNKLYKLYRKKGFKCERSRYALLSIIDIKTEELIGYVKYHRDTVYHGRTIIKSDGTNIWDNIHSAMEDDTNGFFDIYYKYDDKDIMTTIFESYDDSNGFTQFREKKVLIKILMEWEVWLR